MCELIPQFVEKLKRQLANGQHELVLPIQGDGLETRAFCYVDDIVEGLMIMERFGSNREIYHIGNDHEVSILGLINEVEKHLNVSIKVETGLAAEGGTPRRCPDITKMKMLGYNPKTDLSEGLSKTISWYMDKENNSHSGML